METYKFPKPSWAVRQLTRHDRHGMVEDICKHGVGHPNRAWMKQFSQAAEDAGIHGCDGCCNDKTRGESDLPSR